MIRKTVIGVGVAMVASLFLFGRDSLSYMKTAFREARQAVKQEVPIEFEIQRARDLVANLVPDIRRCMHVIAEEEVNVEHLQHEIARADGELRKQKDEIVTLRNDIGKGNSSYRYASRTYTAGEVKTDLSQRFERFKTAEATVDSKRQILDARTKSIGAARQKLEGMISAKRDLEVQIENLEARLRTIQAAQTSSDVSLDDSQLTQAKKLIAGLNKQLDVAQRLLDSQGSFTGTIPVDAKPVVVEDLAEQIDDHFGLGKESSEKVAKQ